MSASGGRQVVMAGGDGGAIGIVRDVAYIRDRIVNVFFYGAPGANDREWVLIDAGLPGTARSVREAARERFGDRPPEAIVLTHGHFDHVGALKSLVDEWDVPVYAHGLEHPYLDGRSSYPPPDPAAGGGMMGAGFVMRGRDKPLLDYWDGEDIGDDT